MKKGEAQPMAREEINTLLAQIRENEGLAEEAFVAKCLRGFMGGWVPLEEYLKLYATETPNAVYKRVQSGAWKHKVHYAKPKGSPAWVNLIAVRLWLEGQLQDA